MEITEFCKKVKRGLETQLGQEETVTVNKIVKNNGVVLNSVIITRRERNISPNIYLDDFFSEYNEGKTLCAVVEEIIKIYRASKPKESLDMKFFTDYQRVKKYMAYKIVSSEKNKELLKLIPHIPFLDLAVVFYCYVPENSLGNATILIYNNHLKLWGVSLESLYEDAKANTKRILPAKIVPIEQMMEEIFAEDLKREFRKTEEKEFLPKEDWFDHAAKQLLSSVVEVPESSDMFVMGNNKKLFGAATMLYEDVLSAVAEKFRKNIFILPSSIHELILLPDTGEQEPEELGSMVKEINETQVDAEEVLTNSVYYYSRESKKVSRVY